MDGKPAQIVIEFGGKRHTVVCRWNGQNIPPSFAERLFYQGQLKAVSSVETYKPAAEAPKAKFTK